MAWRPSWEPVDYRLELPLSRAWLSPRVPGDVGPPVGLVSTSSGIPLRDAAVGCPGVHLAGARESAAPAGLVKSS